MIGKFNSLECLEQGSGSKFYALANASKIPTAAASSGVKPLVFPGSEIADNIPITAHVSELTSQFTGLALRQAEEGGKMSVSVFMTEIKCIYEAGSHTTEDSRYSQIESASTGVLENTILKAISK